jgi:hypothetical protein
MKKASIVVFLVSAVAAGILASPATARLKVFTKASAIDGATATFARVKAAATNAIEYGLMPDQEDPARCFVAYGGET